LHLSTIAQLLMFVQVHGEAYSIEAYGTPTR
jgi:hypothetical protein